MNRYILNILIIKIKATFEVLLVGDNLFGEKYFSVLPGTNSTYEVIYLPLLPGKSKG